MLLGLATALLSRRVAGSKVPRWRRQRQDSRSERRRGSPHRGAYREWAERVSAAPTLLPYALTLSLVAHQRKPRRLIAHDYSPAALSPAPVILDLS